MPMHKRIFCAILAALLLLSLIPVTALPAHAVTKLTTSEACIEILKEMEGFIEKPTYDNGQYSVGYGSGCGKDDYPDGITEEEADALLREYLVQMEATVNKFALNNKIILAQNQFDALMLFTYNVGGNWVLSDGLFRQAVISGKTGNAFIYAMTLWSNASAKLNMALVERRLIEADMYLNGSYTNEKPSNYTYVILNSTEGVSDAKVQGFDCNLSACVLAEPTKTGSRFLGWYTAEKGGAWVTELTAANAEQTLYAHWQEGAGDPKKGTIASYQLSCSELVTPNAYDAPGGKVTGTLKEDSLVTVTADYVDAAGVKWGRVSSGKWVKLGDPRIGTFDENTTGNGVDVTVTGDYVNVRSGPGTNYKVVATAVRGDKLTITQTTQVGGKLWGKFRAGWICLEYTTYKGGLTPEDTTPTEPEDNPEDKTPIATGTVSVDQLNIRANPGTGGYLMGCYERGDKVKIYEKAVVSGATWGRTEKGWICLTYVKLDGEETPTTAPTTKPAESTAPTTNPTEPEQTEPTETEKTEGILGTVTSRGGLNIRKAPGTHNASVGSYASGARVRILEQKLHDGVIWGRTDKGWVSMNYIKLDPYTDGTITSGVKGTVTASALCIRKGPGTGYATEGTYSRGTTIQILEMTKTGATTWGRTDKGWVCMDYVTLNQNAETVPPTTQPTTPTTKPEESEPQETTPAPSNPAGTATGTVIASGGLNVRASASTNAAVVGGYARGDKVTILEQKPVDGILWGRTDKGWICLTYVKLDTTASGTTVAGYSCTVTAGSLCIRKGPGTANATVGTYKQGETITILETVQVGAAKWGRTDKGWVCMDYVKMGTPAQPEQTVQPEQEIEAGDTCRITATELCIRKGPGTGNATVGTYKRGQTVVILEITKVNNTTWGRTDKGWVCMDYVQFVAAPNVDTDKETEAAPDAGEDKTDDATTQTPDPDEDKTDDATTQTPGADEDSDETAAPEESEPVSVFGFTCTDFISSLNAGLEEHNIVTKVMESTMEDVACYEFVAISDGGSYGVAMFIELAEDGKKVAGITMVCGSASERAIENLAAFASIAMMLVDDTITDADVQKMMSEPETDEDGTEYFIMERASGLFAFEADSAFAYFYMYPAA